MPPVFKSGTGIRGFRTGLRPMLNYDPNRYDHDPNNPPLTPRQIMALAKKASRTPPKESPMKFPAHKPHTSIQPVTMRAAGVMIRLPDNTILVGRRSPDAKTCPGHLQIPGGKAEPHESARDAALRELKEETGLVVDSRLLVPLDFEHRVKNAVGEVYESHVFLLDVSSKPKNIQNLEGKKYGPWVWMSMAEVLDNLAIPGLVLAINHLAAQAGKKDKPEIAAAIKKAAPKSVATKAKAKAAMKAAKAKHPQLKKFLKGAKAKLAKGKLTYRKVKDPMPHSTAVRKLVRRSNKGK